MAPNKNGRKKMRIKEELEKIGVLDACERLRKGLKAIASDRGTMPWTLFSEKKKKSIVASFNHELFNDVGLKPDSRLAITRLRVRLKGLIEGYVRDHYANRWRYLVFKRRNYGIGEATELSSTHPSASNNVPSLSNPEPAAISQGPISGEHGFPGFTGPAHPKSPKYPVSSNPRLSYPPSASWPSPVIAASGPSTVLWPQGVVGSAPIPCAPQAPNMRPPQTQSTINGLTGSGSTEIHNQTEYPTDQSQTYLSNCETHNGVQSPIRDRFITYMATHSPEILNTLPLESLEALQACAEQYALECFQFTFGSWARDPC